MRKNIVTTIVMALLILPLVIALSVGAAAPPNWNAEGSYQWLVADTYAHDLTITTQNPDGTFTGVGGYPAGSAPYTADGQTAEVITGQVVGNTITFTTTYAGPLNPGYSVEVSGVIATDGSMSGLLPLEWHTLSGNAVPLGALAAEDFGVVDYDTGLGQLSGYTAGFGLTDATFAGVQSVVVQLFSGATLLQTNTATAQVGVDIVGTQISSPFDVSGTFDYLTDGYWTNVRESEYDQGLGATRVLATVTLANGKIVTAENINLVGDPATILPDVVILPGAVNLLSAGNFTILSKTGITNTGSHTSVVTGNIGSSPITAAAMNTVFCSEVSGTIYGTDAAYMGSGSQTCFAGNPPLANKTLVDNAVLDMGTAYTNAAGLTNPTATELGAGNIGGMTLAPGLYKWSTNVEIPTNLTLSGDADDVWVFQIAGDLNLASAGSVPSGIKVILSGGAAASNIFWQVGGLTGATLGTYSTFNGTILSAKEIIIQTGAVMNGRALAQTQVTLDGSTVSASGATVPPTPTTSWFNAKQGVITDLGTLLDTLTTATSTKLDQVVITNAIQHMTLSIDTDRWSDPSHLYMDKGQVVFVQERKAASSLDKLAKSDKSLISDSILQSFVQRIVAIDRGLALTQITDATAQGGEASRLTRANADLAAGDSALALGQVAEAIDHYKLAWGQAMKSLK
ncbi:MAG: ice-binding family protein [Patescibacteria group bacterium]